MKIELREDAVPYTVHGARPVAFPQHDQVKGMLEDTLAKGIMEFVGDWPLEWCHPMVIVQKPNGKL